jgi:hypothetical protein
MKAATQVQRLAAVALLSIVARFRRTVSVWPLAAGAVACTGSSEPLASPDGGVASESGCDDGWAADSGGDSSSGRVTDSGAADGSTADVSTTDGSATDPAADAALTDKSCAAIARELDCIDCCQHVHAAGILAYLGYLHDCVCANGSPCQTECAMDICAGPPEPPPGGLPAGACATCISSGSLQPRCGKTIAMACTANADCEALSTCDHGCPAVADAGGKH